MGLRFAGGGRCWVWGALLLVLPGCARPITTEFYTRTPPSDAARMERPTDRRVRVAVGADTAALGSPLIEYARERGVFESIGWARPENIDQVDCQIECRIDFEHEGDAQVHYCLARLICNVYNADHSELWDRLVLFHEAMYTPDRKNRTLTHDGSDVHVALRDSVLAELFQKLTASAPPS